MRETSWHYPMDVICVWLAIWVKIDQFRHARKITLHQIIQNKIGSAISYANGLLTTRVYQFVYSNILLMFIILFSDNIT